MDCVSEILYIGLRTKAWLCVHKYIIGPKIWEVSSNGDLYEWNLIQRSIAFRWFVNLINVPSTYTLCRRKRWKLESFHMTFKDLKCPRRNTNSFFTLDAGLLARSQYSEGPATGHLDIGFSWFPCA